MKTILLPLVAGACVAYGDFAISEDDLFAYLSTKTYDLSPEQINQTRGKDCIVTALFSHKEAWIQSIPTDSRSYVGVLREHDKRESDAFSCAGGTENMPVFNRSQPGTKMSGTVIYDTDTTPYIPQEGEPVSLQQIYDALKAGNQVAMAVLRSPSPGSLDMMALTIWDGKTYTHYVVGCEIASSADNVGLVQLDMDDARFVQGYSFVGTGYGLKDIKAANVYAIQQVIPEPATATLGLLGIAALGLRRRRKSEVGG